MTEDRTYVDFHAVRPEHLDVHDRLENWARWQRGRGSSGGDASPMFRLYRAPQHWRGLVVRGDTVDTDDAVRMQGAVSELPGPERMALQWCYVIRKNPVRSAQLLGTDLEGLAQLIDAGRQLLVDVGA